MFEESLISDKMAKEPRKRKTFLSLAFLVHGFGFLAMLFFQYWTVDALPEPPVQVSFFTALQAPPPPPRPTPPPAPEPVTKPSQPPTAPTVPVQPNVVPDAEPQPEPQATVSLTDVVPDPNALPSNGSGDPQPGPPGIGDGPATAEGESGILPVGGAVSRPVGVYQPQPQYPEMARRARIQGIVMVEAIIDKNGNVTDVQLRRGLPYGLSEAALKTVAQWKFKPATLNGQPVAVYYNLSVRFTLQ